MGTGCLQVAEVLERPQFSRNSTNETVFLKIEIPKLGKSSQFLWNFSLEAIEAQVPTKKEKENMIFILEANGKSSEAKQETRGKLTNALVS